MKNRIKYFLLAIIAFAFIFNLSSCFTIGAALIAPGNEGRKASTKDVGLHEGWHKPEKNNVKMKLVLSNGIEVSGYYKECKFFETEEEFYQFAIIKTEKKTENVPLKFIVSTEIFEGRRKMSKGTAALIGLGLDIALIAIAAASWDGPYISINLGGWMTGPG